MKKGQTAVVALYTVGILLLGIFLSWPVIRPIFLGFQSDDNLVNFMLDAVGFLIIIAAVIAYFVFNGVERGR